jgi:hypothetical protein
MRLNELVILTLVILIALVIIIVPDVKTDESDAAANKRPAALATGWRDPVVGI